MLLCHNVKLTLTNARELLKARDSGLNVSGARVRLPTVKLAHLGLLLVTQGLRQLPLLVLT